ncbi:hypothetical protein [Vreelandella alkaliphila]|uniref:hypothetical protein n=1 Tax=Vreelandella alkaliphila TaxID=272774 RepID=UPI003F96B81B
MKMSKLFQWNEHFCVIRRPAVAILSSLLALPICSSAWANENVLDTLQVHGFLSQALIITDDNDFFGSSSENAGSLEYTEIGVNASIRPHRNVLVAAQVLSRRAGGETSDAIPTLDYGVVDYQMVSNQQRTLGLQVGRFKNPFGIYNQTRDVAFTRPSILLPQSIYFDRTRSLGIAGDGASIYHEERTQSGVFRFQAGVGKTRIEDDVDQALGLKRFPGSLRAGSSAIGQIRYEDNGGHFLMALSTASANADYEDAQPPLTNGSFQFQPWVFSLQYNDELWSLTSEYALRTIELDGFNPAIDQKKTGESWYVQYTRRMDNDWQWLIRFDRLVNDRNDRSGTRYAQSGLGPAHSQFADDITFGVQWTPRPNLMLAGEYHHVDGTGWLPLHKDADASETSRHWNMLLFQLSLRF